MNKSLFNIWFFALRLGLKKGYGERVGILGKLMLLTAITVAYAGIFRGIPENDLATLNLTATRLIWYTSTTEFFFFCGSLYYKEIQEQLLSGRFDTELLRPCPVWILKHADWWGQFLARFSLLLAPVFLMTGLVAGDFKPATESLWGALISIPLSALIYLPFHFAIGSLCLRLKQSEPVFGVFQKSLFLLGGLLWPLMMYPEWIRRFVWFTPCPAIVAAPGTFALETPATMLGLIILLQMAWALIAAKIMSVANHRLFLFVQKGGA